VILRRSRAPLAFAAACALAAPAALAQQPEKPPALSVAKLERAIHDSVNRERRAQKLKPLTWDRRLAGVARGHSRDMAKRSYFSHESPEGQTFGERYRKARYICAVQEGRTTYRGAENIWKGYQYASVKVVNGTKHFDWRSEDQIARAVVEGWMKSPGHRANILTARLTRAGIGLAVAPDRQIYVTQNFC
jgi:uncharacterized protein YkwD